MNKGLGYALGFVLVLLIVAIGFYVALTGYRSTRAALLAQPTSTARPPTRTPRPTSTPTLTPLPTPLPGITFTLTAALLPSPTPTPTAKPGKKTPTAVAALPTPVPPTVPPVSSFAFRQAEPVQAVNTLGCCRILGYVRDASGNPLEGIRLQAKNQWNPPETAVSKGGIDAGYYDFAIGKDAIAWEVWIVDEAGNPISPRISLAFDPAVGAYQLNWRRTN